MREVGETFEATEGRALQLDAALPGYVSIGADSRAESGKDEHKPAEADNGPENATTAPQDLSKLTVAQLKELAAERDIKVPSGTKKAQLIALLEE